MMVIEFVVSAIGLRTVRHGATRRYHVKCIQQTCKGKGTLVPLNKRIWILLGKYAVLEVLSCFEVNLIRGFFALAQSYKVNFDAKHGLRWLSYSFDDIFVPLVPAYKGIKKRSAFTQAEIPVRYWRERATEEM